MVLDYSQAGRLIKYGRKDIDMGKQCKDRERIARLFSMNMVDYSKKTYGNIRNILETFAEVKNDLEFLPKGHRSSVLRRETPTLFRVMISSDKLTKERIEQLISAVLWSGKLQEMIDDSLALMEKFSEDGKTYCQLLLMLYFGDEIISNAEAEKRSGYSHSVYQVKKELAIMLFGTLFWKEMLEYWDNAETEMRKIEIEEGREGYISKIGHITEDRRSGIHDRRRGDRRVQGDRRISTMMVS